MKGRTPATDAERELRGNPGKRPAPEKSDQGFFSEPGGDPWSPPDWLSEHARAIFRAEIETARREARLQASQLPLFAAYCDALHRLEKYTRELDEHGATYETKTGFRRLAPEVTLRDRAAADVKALAAELMLTPKSWVSGMGTYAGRQLELFQHGGRSAPTPQQPGAAGGKSPHGSVDEYTASRPAIH